jgi:hypothetical protein
MCFIHVNQALRASSNSTKKTNQLMEHGVYLLPAAHLQLHYNIAKQHCQAWLSLNMVSGTNLALQEHVQGAAINLQATNKYITDKWATQRRHNIPTRTAAISLQGNHHWKQLAATGSSMP